MSRISVLFVFLATSLSVRAAQPLYGQCGGLGYSGDITCVSGGVCTKINDFYSQCLPGATSVPVPTTSTPVSTPPITTPTSTSTVTSTPIPSQTPINTNGADVSTADVVKAFTAFNVSTRFTINFNPTAILGVTFTQGGQTKSFKAGENVARNVTAQQPVFSLYGTSDPGPFVIVMADPDVPTPANPSISPVRHYLGGNWYPTPTSSNLQASGTAITPYFQPTPGVGSPAHRYTYLLYKQPANFNQQRVVTAQTSIVNFNVSAFAAQTGLGDPIAGTFMMTVM